MEDVFLVDEGHFTVNLGKLRLPVCTQILVAEAFDNLKITVKRVSNGIVSNYFLDNIKVGDIIEVSEPMGEFVLDIENNPDQVFFWGAGSGITPIFSIMRELLYSSPSTMIHFTYGNSTNEESIFLKELLDLSDKHREQFNLNLFFSRDHNKLIELSFSGRINSDFVKGYTMNHPSTFGTSQHFICGPSQMKEMIIESLVNIGLPRESIFSEDFQLTVNEQDLIEVIDSEAELHVNGKEFNVLVQRGKTILDAYLDNGIDLPYSCQTGSCDTCKARIVSGETKMIGVKERLDLSKHETLLCCSFPVTQKIQIEI
jgi:ring-1,2-phenylacetyl-CoA epoxidase subunit PaaE